MKFGITAEITSTNTKIIIMLVVFSHGCKWLSLVECMDRFECLRESCLIVCQDFGEQLWVLMSKLIISFAVQLEECDEGKV